MTEVSFLYHIFLFFCTFYAANYPGFCKKAQKVQNIRREMYIKPLDDIEFETAHVELLICCNLQAIKYASMRFHK